MHTTLVQCSFVTHFQYYSIQWFSSTNIIYFKYWFSSAKHGCHFSFLSSHSFGFLCRCKKSMSTGTKEFSEILQLRLNFKLACFITTKNCFYKEYYKTNKFKRTISKISRSKTFRSIFKKKLSWVDMVVLLSLWYILFDSFFSVCTSVLLRFVFFWFDLFFA